MQARYRLVTNCEQLKDKASISFYILSTNTQGKSFFSKMLNIFITFYYMCVIVFLEYVPL